MHLNIKRNQQESNILLDSTEMKLNMLLSKLNNRHVLKNYKEIVKEDEFQRFEGVTYENLTLSQTITNKLTHQHDLIDQLIELIVGPKIADLPTTLTQLPGLEGVPVIISEPQIIKENKSEPTSSPIENEHKSLIPERDFYFKKGHGVDNRSVNKNVEKTEEVVKRPRGFQKKI